MAQGRGEFGVLPLGHLGGQDRPRSAECAGPLVRFDRHARSQQAVRWLVDTEKVVLPTTLTEAPRERTRVVNAPAADVIAELKATGAGDILVNTSPTITKALLAADLLDRLYLLVCPEIAGDGQRLFDDGLPSSKWALTHQETGELGEIAMVYDRAR